MRRYGKLFSRLVDRQTCVEALKRAKRYKASRKNVAKIASNAEHVINEVQRLLLSGTYKTSRFHNKLVHEPKLRIIYSLPFFPDRIIHHALLVVLEPIWESLFYKHSYACRKNKGQHRASVQCMKFVKKYKYCAQLDISQFYINIDHEILKRIIRHKIKDKQILAILDENIDAVDIRANNIRLYKKLIRENKSVEEALVGLKKLETAQKLNDNRPAGCAVGSLTSQWFGNLYMTDFDFYITRTLGHPAYIRFCDDLLLFADDKSRLHELVEQSKAFLLETRRLVLSKARIFPTTQGVDFCGYRHFPTGVILLRKRTAKAAKQRIKTIPYELYHGMISKEQAVSKIAATKGWISYANTHNLSKHLAIDELLAEVNAYEAVS